MSFGKCSRCGEYGAAVEKCPCKPFWCFSDERDLEENGAGECIWAQDAEEAAKKYAEKWAYFDSSYCDGGDVWVRDGNDDTVLHYDIRCEWLPSFSARLVKNGETTE